MENPHKGRKRPLPQAQAQSRRSGRQQKTRKLRRETRLNEEDGENKGPNASRLDDFAAWPRVDEPLSKVHDDGVCEGKLYIISFTPHQEWQEQTTLVGEDGEHYIFTGFYLFSHLGDLLEVPAIILRHEHQAVSIHIEAVDRSKDDFIHALDDLGIVPSWPPPLS